MFIRSLPSSFHLCFYAFAVFPSAVFSLEAYWGHEQTVDLSSALNCCIYAQRHPVCLHVCASINACVHTQCSYIVSSCAFPGGIVVLCASCSMLRSHMVSLMSVWLYTASRFSPWRGRHIRLFICPARSECTSATQTRGSVCMQCLFLAFLLPGRYFLSFLSRPRRLLLFSLA